MDVINAAKKISEAGANLDKLCKQIADQVFTFEYLYLTFAPLSFLYMSSKAWLPPAIYISSAPEN